MLLSDLGVALRKARKERGLTLKQVGERAGVHFTTLSSLERGRVSEFGVRKLLRVAETLGLELVLRPEGQRYTLDDVARERGGPPRKQDELNRQGDLAKGSNQPAGFLGSAPTIHRELNNLSELAKSLEHGGLLARALRGPLNHLPKRRDG